MRIEELDFSYPEANVATERAGTSRVMLVRGETFSELPNGLSDLIESFESGDLLVINNTKVLARRVFAESGLEILFLTDLKGETEWSVLCPATRWKNGTKQSLPGGVELELIARGRPQTVRASRPLTDEYFEAHGDLPLPPYIQKARDERRNRSQDKTAYQTAWAEKPGSLAAPTASLHFTNNDLDQLRSRGVRIEHVTLHVGLGTFLPVTADHLEEHVMHAEFAEIPMATWEAILSTKAHGKNVWALGTTVTRTLESAAAGLLEKAATDVVCEHVIDDSRTTTGLSQGELLAFFGETKLFIQPGFHFKIVDRLLTNFHQPRSTLIALVAAFAGLDVVKKAYAYAIEKDFRLFSYGDLSAWMKN